jgi:hypothetical protein
MSSNQMNGQKGSTDTSSIPRPTNTQNNQKIINNKRREELVNTSDNSKQSMNSLEINLLLIIDMKLILI